MVNIR